MNDDMLTWNEAQNEEISSLSKKLLYSNGRAAQALNRLNRGAEKNVFTRLFIAAFMPHKWGK